MGICCSSRLDFLEDPTYSNKIDLFIQERDRSGRVITRMPVTFLVSSPSEQNSLICDLLKTKFRLSGCVIPGLDPRGECDKDCQDSFALMSKDNNIFCILFDGHGKDGRRVSLFCRDFMLNYFHKNFENFEVDPSTAIEEMVDGCDCALHSSGVECNLSGTTAVVLVINSLGIHAGSVGDSRAIIASLPKSNSFISPEMKKQTAFNRPVQPKRVLNAVQLTVDQKPNHEEELKRIRGSGGVVEKLADDFGRPVGPYRVWKKNGNLPGLAMSRSIGDRIAHEIGVISTPICHSFNLYPAFDQFIVLASDGVWDVMDNFEVANFVEKFRSSCQNSGIDFPARTSNSNIARLLCEEARFRWFGVVEEEDVMIDDISCVVIEIGFGDLSVSNDVRNVVDRKVDKFKSIAIDTSAKRNSAVRKDPTRGSMATAENEIEQALIDLQNEDTK
jgi:serine/threonine protein phosphatase PrpC